MRWFGWFREPESTPEIHSPSFWGRIQPAREYRPCAVKTCRTLFLYQGKEGDGSEKCASCAGRALTALNERTAREAEAKQLPARVVAIGRKR
jgi:7-cyano-7-deazaguanine synthase in queuosine biosynthesis